ncbi:2725_t:CDS:2, partial [Scutellospora calospora]
MIAKVQSHILPLNKPNECSPIANIKLYISKRPPNADEEFFLHPLINYS